MWCVCVCVLERGGREYGWHKLRCCDCWQSAVRQPHVGERVKEWSRWGGAGYEAYPSGWHVARARVNHDSVQIEYPHEQHVEERNEHK